MLGQWPKRAGSFVTSSTYSFHIQTLNLMAHLDAGEWEMIPQPFLLLSGYRGLPSCPLSMSEPCSL